MNTRIPLQVIAASILACTSLSAIPFNDSLSSAANLGNAESLYRQSDPRVGTFEDFENSLGLADTLTPISNRTGSLWFRWTAPSAGTYHVIPLASGDIMDVYRISGGLPGANIPSPLMPSFSELSFTATAGEQFFIRHTSILPDPFPFFGAPSTDPLGFIVRKEGTGKVTDFGVRPCLAAYLTSFGASNSEKYRWNVTSSGNYRLNLEVFDPGATASLRRNGSLVTSFVTNTDSTIAFTSGDQLEITLSGPAGYAPLTFVPEPPVSEDLGSVSSIRIPGAPDVGFAWIWTAPANGFLKLGSQTTQTDVILSIAEEGTFDFSDAEIGEADSDCETLAYGTALVLKVEAGTTYEFSHNLDFFGPFPDGCISLDFFASPSTTAQRIDAASAEFTDGSQAGLLAADAHLAAALAADSTNPRANMFRAITRLALLEVDPAYTAFLQTLDIGGGGMGIFDVNYVLNEGVDGLPVFPPNANATERVAALRQVIVPRLNEIRGYLNAAVATDTQKLVFAETAYAIDEADIMALKGSMNIIQAFLDLLAVYDLGGSINAIIQLERDGELNLEDALAQFPNLLNVASSQAIADFKTDISGANTLLCAALVKASGERTICGSHFFPPVSSPDDGEFLLGFIEGLEEISAAFQGPTMIGGETVDLSQWNASTASLRALLPPVRGNSFAGLAAPDPTLGGILPSTDKLGFDKFLGSLRPFSDPAGFSSYIQGFDFSEVPFFLRNFSDDADGDGDSNGVEFYFGSNAGNPSVRVQGPTASFQKSSGGDKLRTTFVRRIGAMDTKYVVAVSDDLKTWDYSEALVTTVGSPVPVGDGQGEIVTVEVSAALATSRYVRIHAVPN